MTIRITTVCENTALTPELDAEWGLSTLIETDDTTILFDTGGSTCAADNSEKLGIDLGKIDRIVLSHGHFDHTGGLLAMLSKINRQIPVLAHPDIWESKRSTRRDEGNREIGIPYSEEELRALGAVFEYSTKPVELSPQIITTGEVPMVTEYETIDEVLSVMVDGELKPDSLNDDQAIVVKSSLGLVIVLGCAHRGAINTIYHAQNLTGIQTVYAVFGGSHLISASEERIWMTINALQDMDVQKVGFCHCTGKPAMDIMERELGDRFVRNSGGSVFVIE